VAELGFLTIEYIKSVHSSTQKVDAKAQHKKRVKTNEINIVNHKKTDLE